MIYGTLSKLTKKADRQTELSNKMFAAWQRFVELTPGDKEIAPIVRDRYNPYLGRLMK